MSPITHLLIAWSTASCFTIGKKDRTLATIAGVVPDIDGAGLLCDLLLSENRQSLTYWSSYHHTLGHNIGFGLLLAVIAFLAARRRWLTSGIVLLCFHLHLVGDLLGSRGPDGYQWPIAYLKPFSDALTVTWAGQWHLNAWPNVVITAAAIGFVFYQTNRFGISPLEMRSAKANSGFVSSIRSRFQNHQHHR